MAIQFDLKIVLFRISGSNGLLSGKIYQTLGTMNCEGDVDFDLNGDKIYILVG